MSDTQGMDSRGAHSDFEGDPDPEHGDLESQRACVMKAVPGFMKGAYRSGMRLALAEIDEGRARNLNMYGRPVGGNSSCCFPNYFCTDLSGVARFPRRSCTIVSRLYHEESMRAGVHIPRSTSVFQTQTTRQS